MEEIKEDYSLPWVRGREHISQEGTLFFRNLREGQGWSHDDVWELSGGMLNPALQALIENEWGPYFPTMDELECLAVIYRRKPGELLDECYETKGRELLAEEEADSPPTPEDEAFRDLERRSGDDRRQEPRRADNRGAGPVPVRLDMRGHDGY